MIGTLIVVSIITVSLIGVYFALIIFSFIRNELQIRKLKGNLSNLSIYKLGDDYEKSPNSKLN